MVIRCFLRFASIRNDISEECRTNRDNEYKFEGIMLIGQRLAYIRQRETPVMCIMQISNTCLATHS